VSTRRVLEEINPGEDFKGDSDTLACITGGMSEACYGPVPPVIREKVEKCLTEDVWAITEEFCQKYQTEKPNNRVESEEQ